MLKTYIICAGCFFGSTSLANAQNLLTPNLDNDRAFRTIQSHQINTVRLASARPDFIIQPSAGTQNENVFQFSDQTEYAFKSNLAETFKPATSNLLLEPSFKRGTSNDAGLESYSAELRVGNVSFERNTAAAKGWYIFAAADGEALSMKTGSIANMNDPMTVSLGDQITIGDLQAGISTYVMDGTQFTISYIETEASYSGQGGISASKRESFAGFSLAKEF